MWTFDNNKNEWTFSLDNEKLYKIRIFNKPKNKINKFIVKSYISTFFAGKKKTKIFEKKNMLWWKVSIKKIKDTVELEKYLILKKDVLQKKYKI